MLVCLVALLGIAAIPLATRRAAASTIRSQKARIATIEQRIVRDGARIQELVLAYNKTEARETYLEGRVTATTRRLNTERADRRSAGARLRKAAINAYVMGASDASVLATLNSSGNGSGQVAVYANVAAGSLGQAIANYQFDEHRVE
ncbi:MAG: hypothetical protein ACRDZ5_12600, partial [Acidimicrobiales bacterium]